MSLLRAVLTAGTIALPLPVLAQQTAVAARATVSIDAVDQVFSRWTSDASPGCAIGVARDGVTALSRAYGMADLEHGIRNSPETIFEAGSVSKQFTAAAIVLLVQDGVLSLDDDVRRYVPELPDYDHVITLRHLLTHTSGLRDWGSVAGIAGWGRGERSHTHDHVIDILSRQRELNFVPGHEYSYSNSGYNLLAVIVDRVSGMSFAEFSRTRIFEPLGLDDTQWRDDYRRIVPGRSSAYGMRGGTWIIDRPIEDVHGNGGLLTTVEDLLAWNRALDAGTIGGEEFTDMMHRQGVLNDGSTIAYASGLVVGELDGVREVAHTGSTSGYRAFLARYPERGIDVAVLCNAGNVNPGQVGRAVARIALGQVSPTATSVSAAGTSIPSAAPRAPALDAAAMQAVAGEYYSADAEVTLTVAVDGDRLIIRRRPASRLTLTAVAPDEFTAGSLGRVRLIRDDAGGVVQLSIQQARVYDLRFDRVR